MSRFKKDKKKSTPGITTASLPDIIFMLLFFFMVSTVLRETELFVQTRLPSATEIQQLERRSLVSHIYIGPPYDEATYGSAPRIQLQDQFGTVDDIAGFIAAEREATPEAERPLMTTDLKVDSDTQMGIVTDVKQELRQVNALRINYSTIRGEVPAGGRR